MKVTNEERLALKKALTTIRIMSRANDENGETKLLLGNIKKYMAELYHSLECVTDDTENLVREEAIAILRTNPDVKISHVSFSEDEFLAGDGIGNIFDEKGYLFEDWMDPFKNGMRIRKGDLFENGWYIKEKKDGNNNE